MSERPAPFLERQGLRLPAVKISREYAAGKTLEELATAYKIPVQRLIWNLVTNDPDLVLRPTDEAKRQELRAARQAKLVEKKV